MVFRNLNKEKMKNKIIEVLIERGKEAVKDYEKVKLSTKDWEKLLKGKK